MGKFLRDKQGGMVSLNGSPVLEKKLLIRPGKECQCQKCGFANWCKGDICFMVQQQQSQEQQPQFGTTTSSGTDDYGTPPPLSAEERSSHRSTPMAASPTSVVVVGAGSLNYLCPDCAVEQGLPNEFWKRNKRAPPPKGKPEDVETALSLPVQYIADCTTVSRGLAYNAGDLIACFCYF
jgi:hypothetical protein